MAQTPASQTLRKIFEGPLTRWAFLRWRRAQFFSQIGLGSNFGLFTNFAEARNWLPANPEFDHSALATEYVNVRTKQVFAYDYPVMWWLERAFREGATRVLDIGGSVGVHFHAYRRYLEMPQDLSWRVVDVPAITVIGREIARRTTSTGLSFVDDLNHALGGNDVWMAAGSLHYLEGVRPGNLLERCGVRPRHILLNKLPLYDGGDYVTAQNIGAGCFAPMYVYNRQRYIAEIESLGYTLRDQWQDHERSVYLPGYPARCFPTHSGLYFERSSTSFDLSCKART
jgi:putative methyltransferase (TIGR04325 family)